MMALRTLVALALAVAASARTWRSLSAVEKADYAYTNFVAEFSKSRSDAKERTFLANMAKIHAHNALNESWTAGVNQFTDMTTEEFKAFYRGYVPNMPGTLKVSNAPADILEAKAEDFAEAIDWRTKKSPKGTKVLSDVKNQGGCGSCWAFSATESIEADIAIEAGIDAPDLAPQQFVDCAPNPEQCGGTGGCQGATAEIAFNYTIAAGGQEEADVYKYTAHTDTCKFDKLPKPKYTITKYTKLPINQYDPLIAAVNQQPVSISVDASRWSMYEKGVYTGCPHGSIATVDIDHGADAGCTRPPPSTACAASGLAWICFVWPCLVWPCLQVAAALTPVPLRSRPAGWLRHRVNRRQAVLHRPQLLGPRESAELHVSTRSCEDYGYNHICSGAQTWGEEGFIRIDATSAKAGTCYNDPTPGDGNGCKGGPKKMTVCGACGILSDSSYPTGGKVLSGH
jgi:cathepsin L